MIMISTADGEFPVIKSADMTDSKEIGTDAFGSQRITDITTAGEFTLGTDTSVNDSGVVYDYMVWGVIV